MTIFEHQTANSTNAKLLAAFMEWEQNSHFMDVARKNNLSQPYVCSVSDKYYEVENRIMIIGQEPYDFHRNDDNWSEKEIQEWGVAYLEKQLWNIGNEKYNPSAFWNFFRHINKDTGYCPCWNNVDKSHRIINEKTVPLTVELEKYLNTALLSNGNTVLLEEIAIVNPSAVLFVTGPNYYQSMSAALKIDENALYELRPTMNHSCSDISEISNLNKPVLWTYHPTFLYRKERSRQLFTKTMEAIRSWLPINSNDKQVHYDRTEIR